MTDFYTLSSKELADINAILVRKTEVSNDSSCFCGSGKKFSSCCRSSPNFWLTDKFKDTLLGFIKSKNWVVDEESVSFIFPTFEKLYLDRLDLCARPNCGSKTTINSHVYGKKHIQGYLNGIKCRIHNPYSTSRNFFNETHTGRELTYRIFCKKCDSELFRNIDNPRQNTKNENNQFLHLLRTQSYQYQFVRQDLSLSHQFLLGLKAVIEIERQKELGANETVISLDWFIANNRRYQYQSRLREKLWNIFDKNRGTTEIPFVCTRTLDSDPLFASGIANPSHDLFSNKITFKADASIFYYIVPSGSGSVYITLASFDDAYEAFIKQLANSSDFAFKKYINHLVSHCSLPLSLILPDSFNLTNRMIDKLKRKNAFLQRYKNRKPSDIDSRKIYARLIA